MSFAFPRSTPQASRLLTLPFTRQPSGRSTQEWFEADASSIHLLVGAVLSLTSCLIAISLTWGINRRIPFVDKARQFDLRANREFYAGILHHFALLVAAISLGRLAGMAVFDAGYFAALAPIHALDCSGADCRIQYFWNRLSFAFAHLRGVSVDHRCGACRGCDMGKSARPLGRSGCCCCDRGDCIWHWVVATDLTEPS